MRSLEERFMDFIDSGISNKSFFIVFKNKIIFKVRKLGLFVKNIFLLVLAIKSFSFFGENVKLNLF